MASEFETVVAKSDLLAAWAILENLTVSLDQIGGAFARSDSAANGAERERAFRDALATYLTPALVKAINDARMRLGQYISEEEAEGLTETIAYWDNATAVRNRG